MSLLSTPLPTEPSDIDFDSLYNFAVGLRNQSNALVAAIERACPILIRELPGEQVPVIQTMVAKFYGHDLWIMRSKKRTATIAWARMVAMFFCHEFTDCTLSDLGLSFGGRDHGTILHAMAAVKARCDVEPPTAEQIKHLRSQISAAFSRKKNRDEVSS